MHTIQHTIRQVSYIPPLPYSLASFPWRFPPGTCSCYLPTGGCYGPDHSSALVVAIVSSVSWT